MKHAGYRLSRRAAMDLSAIADYTIGRFGLAQAREYRDQLKSCFDELSKNPMMGRRAEQLAKGLRCFEHGSHVVYYLCGAAEIVVVRVLHFRMDASRPLSEVNFRISASSN